MHEHFTKFKMEFSEFCQYNFNENGDKIWEDNELDSIRYHEQKHSCLEKAGVPKEVEYCRDVNFASDQTISPDE